jgi:hypothetical protein
LHAALDLGEKALILLPQASDPRSPGEKRPKNPIKGTVRNLRNITMKYDFRELIGIAEVVLLDQILVDTPGTQANLELSANHLSQAFAPTPAPSPNAGDRNGWFSIRFLLRAGDRNGWFCQPQIPAYCFAIDPQLARNSSLRPSTIGQAVNRCLQAHFEDIRHAPLNLFLPGQMELFCFP